MVDEASLLSKYDGPTSFKGKVSFKGGIRQMIKARRLRCERGSVPPPDHCDEPVSTPDGPLGGSTLLGGLKGAVPMEQRVECAHPLSWSFPIDKDGPPSGVRMLPVLNRGATNPRVVVAALSRCVALLISSGCEKYFRRV